MPRLPHGSLVTKLRRTSCTRLVLLGCAMACCALSAAAGTTPHVAQGSSHPTVKHKVRKSSHSALYHSDSPAIAAERATQIQIALIQKGYLSGEPSGNWDAQTISAMQKLQSDNGWQSKVTPDARALIKLGLGPAPVTPAPGATLSSPPR